MHKDKEYIKRLIQRCIHRDPDAWDEFVKHIAPLISYTIKDKFQRWGFNYQRSDIENLKQDILLSIWEKNKLETIKDNAISWICALSLHAASNYIRDLKPTDPPYISLLNHSLKSYYPLPSEELSNKNMQNAIDCALESLNYKENLIIKLLVLYGKKYKEIAQMLNMPIGTILAYASRAKLKLKKKLKKYVIK